MMNTKKESQTLDELNEQFNAVVKRISQQIDSQWLKTLETEEDLLRASVEVTKINLNKSKNNFKT